MKIRLIGLLIALMLIFIAYYQGQLFSVAIKERYNNATCSYVAVNISNNATPQDYALASNAISYCGRTNTSKAITSIIGIIVGALVAIFAKPISKVAISVNKKTKFIKIET